MRETSRMAREVLDIAARVIRPGITTDEIDAVVHEATIAAGGYPSPLNYYFFPKSCCTSVNEVICHGIPDARKLEDGDIVNVDVTVFYKGVHGDLNETFFVGNVDEASQRLVQCTYECLEKAIAIDSGGGYDSTCAYIVTSNHIVSKFTTLTNFRRFFSLSSSVKPGVRFREIGEIISRHATMSRFSVVSEFVNIL
ncbi:hypothetical protein RD792_010354 [Penstemon davidsonii]|uniref:Peptidase M24 domain-containing protein n=1 Tax=Penstemon davidsonii TaxID=160366 RepID=A0ABR0D1L4_9LAMI|nr:hypothetical protein RD792_010354 [Penstemon davidsonii]